LIFFEKTTSHLTVPIPIRKKDTIVHSFEVEKVKKLSVYSVNVYKF